MENQDKKLEELETFAKGFRKIGRKTQLHFQDGMIRNLRSLRGLLAYLKTEDSSITYILTRRIQQDDVERLFGMIRMRDIELIVPQERIL